MSARFLEGVRVLDLTRFLAGPLATRILADLGASVVKLEPPEGELSRHVLPLVNGVSAYYSQANAGKRNISIDLEKPGGAALVGRLADASDVLVENFRPGVLARHALAPADLIERNPRLVICSVSGYGQNGPWAHRRAFAPLVHAESGVLDLAARKRRTAVVPEVQSHGDVYAASMAANSVLAALVERGRSGRGQHLDVSMAEVLLYVNEWTAAELHGNEAPQLFGAWNGVILQLRSGRSVAAAGNVSFTLPAWLRAMGRESLLADPRFASSEAREENRAGVVALLQEFAGSFDTPEEMERALDAQGLALGTVRSISEIAESDWACARGVLAETDEGIRIPAAPFRGSRSTASAGQVRARGADNVPVLREWLGLADAEIARLEADGVLCLGRPQPSA